MFKLCRTASPSRRWCRRSALCRMDPAEIKPCRQHRQCDPAPAFSVHSSTTGIYRRSKSQLDQLFARDFHNHDVHPALIAFLNVVQVPFFPSESVAFISGNDRGRFFYVDVILPVRLYFFAESAHDIDGKADYQNQASAQAADGGTTKIKPAAAKQQQQNNHNQPWIHGFKVSHLWNSFHGVFTPGPPRRDLRFWCSLRPSMVHVGQRQRFASIRSKFWSINC
jgi:hypothetical protein